MQKRRVNGPFYECGKTRELSEAKTKDDSLFYGILEEKRCDMNDLEATTFMNGWLAYTVKAAV